MHMHIDMFIKTSSQEGFKQAINRWGTFTSDTIQKL